MQNSASTGNLTAEQIARGLSNAEKLKRLVIEAKKEKNKVCEFFNQPLIQRDIGEIYFRAKISADRHRLTFEQLTKEERVAIIIGMQEMLALTGSFPKPLSTDDAELT